MSLHCIWCEDDYVRKPVRWLLDNIDDDFVHRLVRWLWDEILNSIGMFDGYGAALYLINVVKLFIGYATRRPV